MGSAPWRTRLAAVGLVAVVATTAVACSSTNSSSSATTSGSGGNSKIPSSAFSDHTGITAHSVRVANVSTLAIGGLFKGALVGTEAYADYVNSTGGVNGRKITVDSADDGFSGAGNKQATQNALTNDFSLVGGFSLQDNFGGLLLAANPGMPNVSVVLDATTNKLPNVYSAVPLNGGWEEGPLQYYKKKFPNDINAVGTVVSDQASAMKDWAGQKYALEQVGFKVIYDPTVPVTQTDYTQNVIAMKNAGVKILFLSQLPQNYASAMLKNLQQQNFHPQVILGSASYSNDLVSAVGRTGGGRWGAVRPEHLALPGPGRPTDPGGGPVQQVGPEGLARVQDGPLHPVRLALGGAVLPGPEERRLQSQPGLPPAGAVQDHLVQRGQHHRSEQSGGQDRGKLLPARRGGQRPVPADQRPGRRQQHQRLPV